MATVDAQQAKNNTAHRFVDRPARVLTRPTHASCSQTRTMDGSRCQPWEAQAGVICTTLFEASMQQFSMAAWSLDLW